MSLCRFTVNFDYPFLDMPRQCWTTSFVAGATSGQNQTNQHSLETDPLYLAGRYFGRTVCCFVDISVLIRNSGGLTALRSSSTLGSAWGTAQGYAPDVLASIVRSSNTGLREVVGMCGVDNVLSEDIKTINTDAPNWMASNDRKLTPYESKGTTRRVKEAWPLFLYDHREFEADDSWKGLLKGPLLLTAYIRIFQGSRLERVTPASIAYVATLLKVYLSKNSWNIRRRHINFYNRIVDLLTSSESEDDREVERLLHWWNGKIYLVEAATKEQEYRDYSVRLKAAFSDATLGFGKLFGVQTDVESEDEG